MINRPTLDDCNRAVEKSRKAFERDDLASGYDWLSVAFHELGEILEREGHIQASHSRRTQSRKRSSK